jgi:hypothetical protein
MRLLIRHFIALLMLIFVFRLAIQAQNHQAPPSLPKSVLLSRLSQHDPLPASLNQAPIAQAIQKESEGFIDRKPGSRYRQ